MIWRSIWPLRVVVIGVIINQIVAHKLIAIVIGQHGWNGISNIVYIVCPRKIGILLIVNSMALGIFGLGEMYRPCVY
jgi:hypothetical protein